jgi:energy-coupling factor transporter ATP-binding protein EcfA2
MHFTDITIDHFGSLKNLSLADLSPNLTLVYGGNGSGKTTLAHFLRGLLFGFDASSVESGFHGPHSAGHVISARSQINTVVPLHNGSSAHSGADSSNTTVCARREVISDLPGAGRLYDSQSLASLSLNEMGIPAWITEDIYRQIFTVGYQEADQFELLTRLCLEDSSGQTGVDAEIRQAELAIEQAIREKHGDGLDVGLLNRIRTLRDQRASLQAELDRLRQTDPRVPVRIREIEGILAQHRSDLNSLAISIADVEARITEVRRTIEEAGRQAVLTIDRAPIENRIATLQHQLNRWSAIRTDIQNESAQWNPARSQSPTPSESLLAIRALVSRLEQRLQQNEEAGIAGTLSTDRHMTHEIAGEVFALCDHLTTHETSVTTHEQTLLSVFANRAEQSIIDLQNAIQGQIRSLQLELSHADNILQFEDSTNTDLQCHNTAHQSHRRQVGRSISHERVRELELQLAELNRQRDGLLHRRDQLTGSIHALQTELEQLQRQQAGTATLEKIEDIQIRISELSSEIEMLEIRCSVLERTETQLRQVIAQLKQQQHSQILDLASQYINRLTESECQSIRIDRNMRSLHVVKAESGTSVPLARLSRGTRDQIALALRLAIIQVKAASSERIPLVLDDVFVAADDERAQAAADLLMEIAADGQQILFLTSQSDVREVFLRRHAPLRLLEPVSEPEPIEPPPEPSPESLVYKAFDGKAEECPGELTDRVPAPLAMADGHWLFYMEVDSSADDLAGLTVAERAGLQAIEIETVGDLLEADTEELEARFGEQGFLISKTRIEAWKAQAEMACRIPMLRQRDAELLYAAGVVSVDHLRSLRPETVFELISHFQKSDGGRHFQRDGRIIDTQQAINWTRWALHSRTLQAAREHAGEFHAKGQRAAQFTSATKTRRQRSSNGKVSTRRQRRPDLSDESRRARSDRFARRRRRLSQKTKPQVTRSEHSSESSESGWKFYLSRSSMVEEAPSIGPKTAERLGRVGIVTVNDLLNADAERTATMLNHRRINSTVIEQWQAQATLVCQIPQLRGHDSQILVACGYTDADEIAELQPDDLFSEVAPFCETSEGERILRGGSTPDEDEIRDWILWAQNSRSLQAA